MAAALIERLDVRSAGGAPSGGGDADVATMVAANTLPGLP